MKLGSLFFYSYPWGLQDFDRSRSSDLTSRLFGVDCNSGCMLGLTQQHKQIICLKYTRNL